MRFTSLSEESLEKFKQACEKSGIKYQSDVEYRESALHLLNFFDLLFEMDNEEKLRQKRLESEPDGFEMESKGRTCSLCKRSFYEEMMWFDKWGLKCMSCHDAYKMKLVPGYVFKDRDRERHITAYDLSSELQVHSATIRKLVRQGKLKARKIPGNGTLVFLRTENPDLARIIHEETQKSHR